MGLNGIESELIGFNGCYYDFLGFILSYLVTNQLGMICVSWWTEIWMGNYNGILIWYQRSNMGHLTGYFMSINNECVSWKLSINSGNSGIYIYIYI